MADLDLAPIRQRLHDLDFAVPGVEAIGLTAALARDVPALVAEVERLRGASTTQACPEGFHWIGQSFATCDQCGLPAWDHAGMAMPETEPLSFAAVGWFLKPWQPGEAEACRAKWQPKQKEMA